MIIEIEGHSYQIDNRAKETRFALRCDRCLFRLKPPVLLAHPNEIGRCQDCATMIYCQGCGDEYGQEFGEQTPHGFWMCRECIRIDQQLVASMPTQPEKAVPAGQA